AGVLLAMLALASPGTGLLEIGAFFLILLAGYGLYNLAFNWWALLVMVLGLVPFVYSLEKPKREPFLVLSILMLIVGSIFIFPRTITQAGVNPLVALVTSALVAGFLWIAARKTVEATLIKPSHDLERLVGKIGEAKTRIDDDGSVQVAGELWSARSEKPIAAGSLIRVVQREGFILIVEKTE
ncbi:MAG TPA: NfeD family protein, partial [Anaerolineales bacterium]|nr:NfeD family protein [Anaerolineales bacterium]